MGFNETLNCRAVPSVSAELLVAYVFTNLNDANANIRANCSHECPPPFAL